MNEDRLKPQEKEERFVCVYCAMIYYTKEYSDREPFRKYFDKIWAKCPRCGTISYKPIEKTKEEMNNGENNNEFD